MNTHAMSSMANQAATSSTPAFPSFQLSSTDSTVIVDNNSGSGSAATLRSTRGASVIAVKGLKFFYFLIHFHPKINNTKQQILYHTSQNQKSQISLISKTIITLITYDDVV